MIRQARLPGPAARQGLLAEPAELILDEPTASLDRGTRQGLMTDWLSISAGRATLLVTHGFESLHQLDGTVVLDKGRAIERGTHQDLKRACRLYRRLHDFAAGRGNQTLSPFAPRPRSSRPEVSHVRPEVSHVVPSR